MSPARRVLASAYLLLVILAPGPAAEAEVASQAASRTTKSLRFASLKSDRVEVRRGPGAEHGVLWVFQRAGLPVEVLRERDGWAEVRDAEGGSGWMPIPLLSYRRTALVKPSRDGAKAPRFGVPLRQSSRGGSAPIAILEPGVIADLVSCDLAWCRVTVGDLRGFVEQGTLWGVRPDEVLR